MTKERLHYDTDACYQFVADMESAGIMVRHYEGRDFWQGPAVVVPAIAVKSAMARTAVNLQTDLMGLDRVVYPVISGRPIEASAAAKMPRRKSNTR
jgi:hypothetical protein